MALTVPRTLRCSYIFLCRFNLQSVKSSLLEMSGQVTIFPNVGPMERSSAYIDTPEALCVCVWFRHTPSCLMLSVFVCDFSTHRHVWCPLCLCVISPYIVMSDILHVFFFVFQHTSSRLMLSVFLCVWFLLLSSHCVYTFRITIFFNMLLHFHQSHRMRC